jgi:hypothetical protein
MWIRYRFKTYAIDDYRPIVYNPNYHWWCSAENETTATIVAWLPKGEPLEKYWDDAFDIETEEHNEIQFTSRFPKIK